jgi:2-dehydro-3-deoxyphosphogluconate aldolase/(4S)-4-hydroxy-2-oxoglutarate aldolase
MQPDHQWEKTRQRWLAHVQQQRAIAVIRAPAFAIGQTMAVAVARGGIRLIEVAWSSDRPADLVRALQAELPNCLIGAGTLLHQVAMEEAIAAGAKFLFSPHFQPDLVQTAVTAGVPVIPGALTPTEILAAWNAGAASIKVFPVQTMGGPGYLRQLAVPLAGIPLIPTGGVTVDNAADFIQAGAVAVGISGNLFPADAIAQQNWESITRRAIQLRQTLSGATIRNANL